MVEKGFSQDACVGAFRDFIHKLDPFICSVSTGVSVTSSNTGVPDISGSVYTKTQVIASCQSLSPKRTETWKGKRLFIRSCLFHFFFCSHLRSRVSTLVHQQLRSACPLLWAAEDPSTPQLRQATPLPPSCTSWLHINNPILRFCTTTCSRMDRYKYNLHYVRIWWV